MTIVDLPGEQWRGVYRWEALYAVSNLGRVKSLAALFYRKHPHRSRKDGVGYQQFKERLMIPGTTRSGHRHIILTHYGKQEFHMLHGLVLETFEGPRPEGMHGCHNDGNPRNNARTNLRWDTPSENQFDRYWHEKNPGQVRPGVLPPCPDPWTPITF